MWAFFNELGIAAVGGLIATVVALLSFAQVPKKNKTALAQVVFVIAAAASWFGNSMYKEFHGEGIDDIARHLMAQGVCKTTGICKQSLTTGVPSSTPSPQPSPWAGKAEFASVLDNLTIPASARYSYYDWTDLQRRAAGVPFPDKTTMTDFKTCYFRMSSKASFLIGGRILLHASGSHPAQWEVTACGARSMVKTLRFDIQAFDRTRVDDIFSSVRDGLQEKGYKIDYLGCEHMIAEKTSYYRVSRSSTRPFFIEAYEFDSAVGPSVSLAVDFNPNKGATACAEKIDLLQIRMAKPI